MPYTDNEALDIAAAAQDQWRGRYEVIDQWRELRYGRDDVLATIPEELQATDFEYHSSELDDAVNELTSFLSAARQTWTVDPAKDREQGKADDIESVLAEVFGPNGILETESGSEVVYSVYQNQVENGHGIYKFILKKDYPLRMPKRRYSDEHVQGYEDNPEYAPRSRRDTREEHGRSRYRETDDMMMARRDEFMQKEFAWQWRSVDPRGYFRITQDGVLVAAGEIVDRPASKMREYEDDSFSLDDVKERYVHLGDPSEVGSGAELVTTFELWDDLYCYFGIVSAAKDDGRRDALQLRKYRHPYGRPPYFEAFGLVSTDKDLAYRWTGAFGKMIAELPLLNHLETMHFNSIHRGFFPKYQPVKDERYRGEMAPLEAEQMIAVTHADMEKTELPPGWRWEIVPSGFEPDLLAQLQASRERIESSSVVAVLRGASPGSADSGAKVSLLINAAARAISPFVRHHTAPLKEMAQMFLEVNRRLKIDCHLTHKEEQENGRILARPLTLRADDVVSTAVDLALKIELPVDRAAMQVQGLTLWQAKGAAYSTVAPEYFSIGDPAKERLRIALEGREQQIDDVAFQQAQMRFSEMAPVVFQQFMGHVEPLEPPKRTVGGGPGGVYGGATAMMGRGETASPSATQP